METLQADKCYHFAAVLKEVPLDSKYNVLPDPFLKIHSVKSLTYEENTGKPYTDKYCLFRALALHSHRNERLEKETYKLFNLLLEETGEGTDPSKFRGVWMEDIAIKEDSLQTDSFLYDFEFVDGSMFGELARRSVEKHSNTVLH